MDNITLGQGWPEPDELKITIKQDLYPLKEGNYVELKGLFIREGKLEDMMKSKIHAPHIIGENMVESYSASMQGLAPSSLMFQVACSFVPKQ